MNLTANGRAHLGHAAGPFLRMDILARHLRRAGHRVRSGLTVDGFENHVLVRARAEGVDPSVLSQGYYEQIRDDLASIGVRYDRFDNPSGEGNLGRFRSVCDALGSSLLNSGNVDLRRQLLPMDDAPPDDRPAEERFCIGGWFAADCPSCGAASGSFFCEACGDHFEPSEAVNPRSRRGNIVEWREDVGAFLRLPSADILSQAWSSMAVEPQFARIGSRYLARRGPVMRLTVPGLHGLSWTSPAFRTNQILFSYSSLLYAHSLYCGAREAEDANGADPFRTGEDTILIGATGIDNTVPCLVGVTGCAMAQAAHRPFDRLFFNHFLKLDGSKFSTSRRHVIWTGDIAAADGVDVDVLRAYLSEICPEESETDLRVDDLVSRHNGWLERLAPAISACAGVVEASGGGAAGRDGALSAALEAFYARQSEALSLDRLRVSHAARPVWDWIGLAEGGLSPPDARAWLEGLSFLSAPLMPGLSGRIWSWLGLPGEPMVGFHGRSSGELRGPPPRMAGRPLSRADVAGCVSKAVAA